MTWTILAARNATGSPGSGDWQENLCAREAQTGFEIAICGYELDENGDESDDLVADPSYQPIEIAAFTLDHVSAALAKLGWSSKDLTAVMAAWAV